MKRKCNQVNELEIDFEEIEHNEKRILWVVALTSMTMIVEVLAGYWTGSMALLADGYHMASHAGALGIAYLVYKLARSKSLKARLEFGSGKLLPLGGYTSAVGLAVIALWMMVESVVRLIHPASIHFNEAIWVAIGGLAVNILSAFILGGNHSHGHNDDHETAKHEHIEDHNHKSALAHVLADALTSVLAIVALLFGKFYQANWLDPIIGIVGACVILRWAYVLCRNTAWELLDGQFNSVETAKICENLERAGHKIIDFHFWKVGPGNYVCQIITESNERFGVSHYRDFLPKSLSVHLVVEERLPFN